MYRNISRIENGTDLAPQQDHLVRGCHACQDGVFVFVFADALALAGAVSVGVAIACSW